MNAHAIDAYCPFTGIKIDIKPISGDYFTYTISNDTSKYTIVIKENIDIENSDYYQKHKHLLRGLWLNKKWPKTDEVIIDSLEDIKRIIEESNVPLTPKEKLDYLFLSIYNKQQYEGERFINNVFFENKPHEYYYFKANIELDYYMATLDQIGLIEISAKTNDSYRFQITFKGLEYAIKLSEEGKFSNNCFIAMSFQPGMDGARQAIKEAIVENRFTPLLIDEQIYSAEQTINDAMLAHIKRSKFCVADFSQHRNGVYFEAGYALGRGMPVIYLCSKEEWSKTHFDVNHFPHVIYNDNEELRRMLSDAIQARIID